MAMSPSCHWSWEALRMGRMGRGGGLSTADAHPSSTAFLFCHIFDFPHELTAMED
ncbi:uncharacterized protein G2W53_004524 [Senna tora]|uniref:Uncharacterized protein n=1 Tax=Senna tora TaxID=362788 RepID=A0A834XDM4_9FABA|nr:uncharacterized protein G2W53_004524 [Senna tora]